MNDDGSFGLALLLAGLAGWVDAAGLGSSGGVFLSFMSGNTTDLAVSVTHRDWTRVGTIAAIVGLFVVGVAIGEIVEPRAGRRGQSVVLAIEALALGFGAALHWPGLAVPAPYWPGVTVPALVALYPLAFAMGMQNATMHRAGGIGIGLTYVTGTLVQIGRSLAGAIGGEGDSRKLGEYAALWLSLAVGAGLGGLVLSLSTLGALCVAAAAAGSLAVATASGRR